METCWGSSVSPDSAPQTIMRVADTFSSGRKSQVAVPTGDMQLISTLHQRLLQTEPHIRYFPPHLLLSSPSGPPSPWVGLSPPITGFHPLSTGSQSDRFRMENEVLHDMTLLDLSDLKLSLPSCLLAQRKLHWHSCCTSGPLHMSSLCTEQPSPRPLSGSFPPLLKCHLSEVFSDHPT